MASSKIVRTLDGENDRQDHLRMGIGDSARSDATAAGESGTNQRKPNPTRSNGKSATESTAFERLIHDEEQWLAERVGERPPTVAPLIRSHDVEPWVVWTPRDHFGLALSGGGIRSATFSMGVLQALSRRPAGADSEEPDQCSVLDLVDYVSTVSGGGYTGGFWSRWLHEAALGEREQTPSLLTRVVDAIKTSTPAPIADPNHPIAPPKAAVDQAPDSKWRRFKRAIAATPSTAPHASRLRDHQHPIFPQPPRTGPELLHAEAPAIRHLRERSRFLMPRVGLFEYQTWGGLVALLGAMLPSLIIAAAVLTLVWHAWLALAYTLLSRPRIAGVAFGVVSAVIFYGTEYVWRRLAENRSDGLGRYFVGALICVPSMSAVAYWLLFPFQEAAVGHCAAIGAATVPSLFSLDACLPVTRFLLPAVPWVGVAGALLLFVRPLGSSFFSPTSIRVIERLTARCLVPALLWSFFAGMWIAVLKLQKHGMETMMPATAATTVVATGLFVSLKDWFSKPIQETRGSRLIDRVLATLRPVLPQVLAYAVALGMLLMVGVAVAWVATQSKLDTPSKSISSSSIWLLSGAAIITLGALILDPRRIGLHEFYRSRIAGTFLGGWLQAGQSVEEDVVFEDLRKSPRYRRPIHLVCTTANDLSGDPLLGLYRGGRSVAISPLGVSLGRYAGTTPIDDLRLSSALTASAAAFNSQMGSISMQLGPAVAFVMSSLGLRLGLWLDHPSSMHREALRGRYLFAEMFGRSVTQVEGADLGGDALHLSDGGHFENLALYELVRRHCRFVIVCDSGADPEVAFDDLANATRRIREDFGIEIELDVEPLRPNSDGLSRQHAVVGTIHYGGVGGSDKGILLYFKPTLVGDEPTDVMQYRTRNPHFPHESTGDQFYDEAQWESYRRLGEHCAGAVFRFIEDRGLTRRENAVEQLFLNALQRWQPVRNVDRERLAGLTERRDALLSEIRKCAPERLRQELFADGASALGLSLAAPQEPREALEILQYCVELASLMNQIYHAAKLETHWAHPSNQAWMAFLNRCASCTSFRRWWPLLRPLCDDGMRDFVRIRFGIRVADPTARPAADSGTAAVTLDLLPAKQASGAKSYAMAQWEEHFGASTRSETLEYVAKLAPWPGEEARQLVVGLLLCDQHKVGDGEVVVRWSTPELFVPPELNGAGFSSRLLDAVVCHFRELAKVAAERGEVKNFTLKVTIADEPPQGLGSSSEAPPSGKRAPKGLRLDPAHRKARESSLHFYKSRGFCQQASAESNGQPRALELRIDPPAPTSTAAALSAE
jgi:hypothetical protein